MNLNKMEPISSTSHIRNRNALIVFMRFPEAGKVKSRLAASLGKREASRIYEKLTRRTLGIVSDFKRKYPGIVVFIFYSPPHKKNDVETHFPGPWEFMPQTGTHLGERMGTAIECVMAKGYKNTVLVGTDLADLGVGDLEDSFSALESGKAVIGPAIDGGFYLIGLSQPCPAAFQPATWGTSKVYSRTESLMKASGLDVRAIEQRRDVDCLNDLKILYSISPFQNNLTVVVPTLHPVEKIASLLHFLKSQIWPGDEIVVVGTHSRNAGEKTYEGVKYVVSPRGRGLQLNAGVSAATGSLLLFLHDDSSPPPQFPYLVRKLADTPQKSIGCFQLAFTPSSRALEVVAAWANFRTLHLKLPYGDQGLFCRREFFDNLGGFKKQFLMEDVDFVQRCKKNGDILVLPEKMLTSPQRYLRKGILRASLQNHLIMFLYRLGVRDEMLYRLYYSMQ